MPVRAAILIAAGAFACSKDDDTSSALDFTPDMIELRDSIKEGETEMERLKAELALASPERQVEIKKEIQDLRNALKGRKVKLRELKGMPAENPNKKKPAAPGSDGAPDGSGAGG